MAVQEIELLEKIVHMQSCIIEGHDIKAVLRKDTAIFKNRSGAEAIALCFENGEHLKIELVLEESKILLSLLREYKMMSEDVIDGRIIQRCISGFNGSRKYLKINSLYELFHGTLSKANSLYFEQKMNFKEAHVFTLYNYEKKKIGFVIYFFSNDSVILEKNLPELTTVFETLIRPFYSSKLKTIYSRCVHKGNNMGLLTEREKQIAYRVLQGKTYKDIAIELKVTVNTLKTHMKNIFSKYGVRSKMELNNKLSGENT
ncbi:helix-turn-helix transcriptional regulator [Sulfurimonas sp.]|uniref:helix-turn-helix transcriptional regulator n=1 Tax=Sulfurimonas sp. TaxID=2022749 RepID=UPI00356A17EA